MAAFENTVENSRKTPRARRTPFMRASKAGFFCMFQTAAAVAVLSAACAGCASETRQGQAQPESSGATSVSDADRDAYTYTLSQKQLLDIIDEQNRLFERMRGNSKMSRSDAISLKNKIDSLWAEYQAKYPDDIDAIILFGKYLRATGDDDLSYDQFLKADSLNPDLPVVKQQLANYEAEHGLARHAYDNLSAAVALAPDNSVYRIQLAELILFFREELVRERHFSQKQLDSVMIKSYERAAKLEPENSALQWKYARAFYDLGKADWNAALEQWNLILREFAPLNIDMQTALANKARVLIELHRDGEAVKILEKIYLPSLQPDKRRLLSVVEKSKKAAEPKKQIYSH